MQSGITASEELLTTFKSFTADTSIRGFIVKIQNEKLIPTDNIPAKSTFESDLSQLDSLLTTNEAAYVILRRDPNIITVTFVPDTANVRQKMLFASTRNTLIRELGSEKFTENIFATEKHELTAEGFKKHDDHVKKDAPLTEEERVLGEVRKLEAEAASSTQTRKSHILGPGGIKGMPWSDEAIQAVKDLAAGKHTLVQIALNVAEENVYLADASEVAINGLQGAISNTDPRYSFIRFKHTYDGQEEEPIIFLYTCPTQSKIKERMVYASSRLGIVKWAEKVCEISVTKTFEASEVEDITEEVILDGLHPKKEEIKTFARPKRPGRR